MKKLFSSFIFLLISPFIYAQQQQNDTQLFIADMLTLADNFAQPAADAAGYQASAGWFSSAATLDPWSYRLSVHANALFVSKNAKTFDLKNSDLKLLEIEGAENAILPTAFGGKTSTFFTGDLRLNPIDQEDVTQVRFMAFEGIGRSYVPHAFVQASVGLPYGTELTVRAMPAVTIDGVTATTFGAGIKHNFSHYSLFNSPEKFQFAAALAYSKLKVEYGFEAIEVDQYLMMDLIDVDADLWMLEGLGSKRWNNFEIFGALGVAYSGFNYKMGGTGAFLPLVNSEIDKIEDSQMQFKGDLGFNLHFGRFRVSTMATIGEFMNANIGLHVRI